VLSFGERECSIQRRHQKLIEESPAPNLTPKEREYINAAAIELGRKMAYRSLGTVEFLMDEAKDFYFIEVNPRIQVEHPVTEMVTGVDLVREQIQLALSGELALDQSEIQHRGAAIEARILAEDPDVEFLPTSGSVSYLKEPGGPGIRVDSALYSGMEITTDYDSLKAKLIAWGPDRNSAIQRLQRGIKEYQIGGIKTDLSFITRILESHPYKEGNITTSFLDEVKLVEENPDESLTRNAAIAAALHIHKQRTRKVKKENAGINHWRLTALREQIKSWF
jgi:acetyl-CoA carboxylase biotin carboxylase subunit